MDATYIAAIIDDLASGIDPITDKIYDISLLNDKAVQQALTRLSATVNKASRHQLPPIEKRVSKNELCRPISKIYHELKDWRNKEARRRGLTPGYLLSNDALWGIANGDITCKEGLLYIHGVGPTTYSNYGDVIFGILKPYIAVDFTKPEPEIEEPSHLENTDSTEEYVDEEFEVIVAEAKAEAPITCDDCQLRRNEKCTSMRSEVCDDFRMVPRVTDEEKGNWPDRMQGPQWEPWWKK